MGASMISFKMHPISQTQGELCADLPQSLKREQGKDFLGMTPCRGAAAQSPLCARPFPALHDPRLERQLHKGAQSSQQFPFCAPKQHSYFWLPPASHPLCRVPKKTGTASMDCLFERLWELSQLGSLGHIPNSSKGCRILLDLP